METSSIILNGIFGLVFAIIGYLAIIRGAQIQAEVDKSKSDLSTNEVEAQQPLSSPVRGLTVFENFSIEKIHWGWWATYTGLGFATLIFFYILNHTTSEYIFWSFLFFLMIVIPAVTYWLAIAHPLHWKSAAVFISILQITILISSIVHDDFLYPDLYEDLPMWAWMFGNISGVIVISIQRQQQSRLK